MNPVAGTIPAKDRFLKIPARDRETQDLLYMGDYLLGSGKKDEARPAYQQAATKYPESPFAAEARKRLEQMK